MTPVSVPEWQVSVLLSKLDTVSILQVETMYFSNCNNQMKCLLANLYILHLQRYVS